MSEPLASYHGKVTGYTNHGCRCAACKDAWATHYRELRHRHAAEPTPPEVVHGTTTTYRYWGCRCADCTRANTEDRRRYQRGAVTGVISR